MRTKIPLPLLVILCISCYANNGLDTDKPTFTKYFRTIGHNNYYYTYDDYILISNYKSNTMRLKELVNYAQHYIDTVKSEMPISEITFIGQPPCKNLPAVRDTFFEHRKYTIFAVAFNNGIRNNDVRDTTINLIALPDKKSFNFYVTSQSIDSLLLINPFIK